MTLRKEDLRKVRNFLIDVSLKWYDLGVELDVEEEALDEIKSVNSNQPRTCLREMLRVRLKDVDNPLTWKKIADALKSKVIHEVELGRKAEAKVSTSLSPDHVLPSRVLAPRTTEPVNQNIQLDLKHQLRLTHDKIINRYAQFVSHLCESIHDKKVGTTNLRTFILRLPAIEGAAGKDSTKEKLLKASTINEIIDLIGNECASFLHCEIYQSILEKYCSDIDHDDLKYSEHLKSYVNFLKVSEFLEINPELKKLADVKNTIAVKVDIVISSKFSKIMDLQSALASILGIWPSNLKLVSIEEGCVIATFAAPDEILDIKKLKDSSEELQSLSVLWLKCDNYKIDFREKSLTRHKMSVGKAGPQSSSPYDHLPLSSSQQPSRVAAPAAIVRRKSSKTKNDYRANPRNPTSAHNSSYDNTDSVSGRYQDQHLKSLSEGAAKTQHVPGKPRVGVTRVSSLRLSRDLASVPDKFSTIPRRSKTTSHSEGATRNLKISRGGSTVSDYNHRFVKYRFHTTEQKQHKGGIEISKPCPPTLSSDSAQQPPHRLSLNMSDKLSPPTVPSSFRREVANSSSNDAKFESSSRQIVKRVSPPKDSSLDDVTYPTVQNLTQLIWTDRNKMKHKLEIVRRVCTKYTTIGILLGMDRAQIHSYMEDSERNSYQCCSRIFTKWIENNGHPPKYLKTWTGLCQLLYSINETIVEHELTEALSRFGISVNASSW